MTLIIKSNISKGNPTTKDKFMLLYMNINSQNYNFTTDFITNELEIKKSQLVSKKFNVVIENENKKLIANDDQMYTSRNETQRDSITKKTSEYINKKIEDLDLNNKFYESDNKSDLNDRSFATMNGSFSNGVNNNNSNEIKEIRKIKEVVDEISQFNNKILTNVSELEKEVKSLRSGYNNMI